MSETDALADKMPDDTTVDVVVGNGAALNQRACDQKMYIRALEANPGESETWKAMGNTLSGDETVVVNGTKYTEQGCYLKAVEIDPANFKAWHNIGVTL